MRRLDNRGGAEWKREAMDEIGDRIFRKLLPHLGRGRQAYLTPAISCVPGPLHGFVKADWLWRLRDETSDFVSHEFRIARHIRDDGDAPAEHSFD